VVPGQLARYLKTGKRETPPPLGEQLALISALYGEMLGHYASRSACAMRASISVGARYRRRDSGAPAELIKAHRARVLTATDPALVLRRLAEAFDAFGSFRHPESEQSEPRRRRPRRMGRILRGLLRSASG